MRAHLVQMNIAWEDRTANHARARSLLDGAAIEPGDLVALPEMFDSGFSLNIERTADDAGRTREFLAQTAQERGVFLYAGLTVRRDDGMGLNRAVVIAPTGATICTYDKLHPFSFGRESERFAPGQRGVVTCRWDPAQEGGGGLTMCPAICYDLRFPELFRVGLGLGAELFVIGANWPRERAAHWRALLIARAIENQAYVIGVNRVGEDPSLSYAGGSLAVSPMGVALREGGEEECVLTVEIDPQEVRDWRDAFPAWRDRRADLCPDK